MPEPAREDGAVIETGLAAFVFASPGGKSGSIASQSWEERMISGKSPAQEPMRLPSGFKLSPEGQKDRGPSQRIPAHPVWGWGVRGSGNREAAPRPW
jgi:hypothetical protein